MKAALPLFSTPVFYDEYTLDINEIELIKKEKFNPSGMRFDGHM